jgi:hypothetical protein
MSFIVPEKFTQREYEQLAYEREQAEAQRQHQLALKKLDIELASLELRWNQIWRLPFALFSLPVRIVLAVGISFALFRGRELSQDLQRLLKF